jgi:N-acetyl-anhydromuramyl-L-alanine amidase AmpD
MQIIYRRIQNFAHNRQGFKPEAIVIHMAEASAEACLEKFNDPLLRNSTHYLVTKKGEVWKLVEETDTAWHAGGVHRPSWKLLKPGINPNLYTIGIAHEGKAGQAWSEEMYQSSAQLIANIASHWDIPLDREHVIGHSQLNSTHNDPGLALDFAKLISLANNIFPDEPETAIDIESSNEASLRNQLSTLQLTLVSAQSENKKLKSELKKADAHKIQELQKQNSTFSEEIYSLQQERNKLNREIDQLQDKYLTMSRKRADRLKHFTTKELFLAIIKRLWRK